MSEWADEDSRESDFSPFGLTDLWIQLRRARARARSKIVSLVIHIVRFGSRFSVSEDIQNSQLSELSTSVDG